MGYQNNERPDDLQTLLLDIRCDLTDLQEDIRIDPLSRNIVDYIAFIKESCAIAIKLSENIE